MQAENKKGHRPGQGSSGDKELNRAYPPAASSSRPQEQNGVHVEGEFIVLSDFYEVPLAQLKTHASIQFWVDLLSQKKWVTTEMLEQFVRLATGRMSSSTTTIHPRARVLQAIRDFHVTQKRRRRRLQRSTNKSIRSI